MTDPGTGRAGTPDPADLLVVVQARTGSTRLPGKVLADVGGRPMLALQLRRLRGFDRGRLVVATSDRPADDAVAELATAEGAAVVRGPEADVLGRFVVALDAHPAATVVRLTGDCPLTDPAIVAAAVDLHLGTGADYTSNVWPRSFPKGLDVEVVDAGALRAAAREAATGPDREHVTPFLYRHPERFRLANLDAGRDLAERWWTVDTADDLEVIRSMVARVADPETAPWTAFLAAEGDGADDRRAGLHLRRAPVTGAGANPWVRSWDVVVDGAAVGGVEVRVGTAPDGSPVHHRAVEVPAEHRAAADAALDALLDGDQQWRA